MREWHECSLGEIKVAKVPGPHPKHSLKKKIGKGGGREHNHERSVRFPSARVGGLPGTGCSEEGCGEPIAEPKKELPKHTLGSSRAPT